MSLRPEQTNAKSRNGGAAWLSIRKNRNRFVPLIRARSHKMTPSPIEWPCSRRGKRNEKDSRPLGNYCSPYTFVHRIGATANKLVPSPLDTGNRDRKKEKNVRVCRRKLPNTCRFRGKSHFKFRLLLTRLFKLGFNYDES